LHAAGNEGENDITLTNIRPHTRQASDINNNCKEYRSSGMLKLIAIRYKNHYTLEDTRTPQSKNSVEE
jgi:hypothetical protein